MVDGPKTPAELDALIEQNYERIEASVRAAKLANAAGITPRTLDDVIEEKPVAPLSEAGRAKVDEWLAGVQATREGLFSRFFIEISDGTGVIVRPENAGQIESDIRAHFAPYYPEIAHPIPEV